MAVQISLVVALVTLAFSIPVFALEYYWVFLLGSSVKYPRDLGRDEVRLDRYPIVSILIATFNERYVIERSLEAIKSLDYPKDKLQVVVADDSNDKTIEIIEGKVR